MKRIDRADLASGFAKGWRFRFMSGFNQKQIHLHAPGPTQSLSFVASAQSGAGPGRTGRVQTGQKAKA